MILSLLFAQHHTVRWQFDRKCLPISSFSSALLKGRKIWAQENSKAVRCDLSLEKVIKEEMTTHKYRIVDNFWMKSQLTASVLRLVWLKNFYMKALLLVFFFFKSLLIFIVINWSLRCANWTNETDLYCKCVIREFKVLMLQHESSWNECMYIFLHLFSLWGHFIYQWRWNVCGKLDPALF